jgi:hypothetical protein
MTQVLPHIHIGRGDDERVIVAVRGRELCYSIEDYLGEDCDLFYEDKTTIEWPDGPEIKLYFPVSVRLADVEASLIRFSPQRVAEIYRLINN